MAKNDMGLGSDASGLNGHIRRALAIAHHDNPLSGQLITRLEGRHMNDFPLELIASLEEGDVRCLRVEANAYDREIEVFGPFLRFVTVSDPPPQPGPGLLLQTENRVAESNVRQDSEVACIVSEIPLKGRARREIRGFRGQWPVRELVEFLLHLDAEVEIPISPDAAESRTAFEERAVQSLRQKNAGSRQSGNACANNCDAVNQ